MPEQDRPGVDAPLVQIQRSARALIGWVTEEQGLRFMTGQRGDVSPSESMAERLREARKAVAARRPIVDQSDVIRELPNDVQSHVGALREVPAAQAYFNEGWRPALADLGKVCALQTHIFTDHAEERTTKAVRDNWASLIEVSLPLPKPVAIPAQFDEVRQAWIISSPNPNLRVVGNWAGQVQPGAMGFGFIVNLLPSFVQVACISGRHVLRDGYHRALGFLKRGIFWVPVFVRDYSQYEELGLAPGLLPPTTYMSDKPPALVDYFDDAVSAEVSLPAFQKMIVIHGLELTPIG